MSDKFFSETKSKKLIAFPLTYHYIDDLDPDELSRLVAGFNAQFSPFYNLFVQFAFANNDRGKYHLWAIKGSTHSYAPSYDGGTSDHDTKIQSDDELKLKSFIAGFTHGLRAFRKKKNRFGPTTRRY